MGYPMILEKDFGFGVEFPDRRSFLLALKEARDSGKLSAEAQEEIWTFARDFERKAGLAGDTERFSSGPEDINIS